MEVNNLQPPLFPQAAPSPLPLIKSVSWPTAANRLKKVSKQILDCYEFNYSQELFFLHVLLYLFLGSLDWDTQLRGRGT